MSGHKNSNEAKSLRKNSIVNVLDGNNLIQNNNYKAEISPEKFLNILNVTRQKRQNNVSQSLSKIHDKTQSSLISPFLTSSKNNSNKLNFDNENLKSRKLSHQQIFLHSTYTQKEAKITDFTGQNPYKNQNQLSNQHL
ncbi:hypothetical protein PPERSA_06965 [Pseudocohnilembus persalinus]|uniref:Uncharacterized protein n=1 Tax=Pseudocohnilembus persalinus TaxID=266149 RepID=A0A0V0QYK3_PSEPJ|nr:hypothetical protein PPERSA_06965 [Pseudocohnilembus persalinus]|eukprot:KRX07350.1 hypothetical protein PPERSA_06965 [Pseudocohnilembus persalinus]